MLPKKRVSPLFLFCLVQRDVSRAETGLLWDIMGFDGSSMGNSMFFMGKPNKINVLKVIYKHIYIKHCIH